MALAAHIVSLAAVTHGLPLGGSSTFLLNLATARVANGQPLPIVSTAEKNELTEEFAGLGIDIQMVEARGRIFEDRLARAYELLAAHHPQAVLACLSSESFEMLRLAPPGVVRLGIIQSDDPGPYEMARQYAAWIDAMVGVSGEICGRLSKMPEFSATRIAHIPYGIAFGAEAKRPERPPETPLRVAYVGRIVEEQKRVSRLAEVAKQLAELGVNVEFSIVGGGPSEDRLRAALSGNPLVRWCGVLRPREVMPFLAEQDVFLLLSDYEGLPLSLLEAMAAGAVPVVSDLPSGMREVVSEECGIRVPVGDVQAAVEAIVQLERDRSRVKVLSQQASQHARTHYSAERMNRQFEELIASFPSPVDVRWPSAVPIPVPLGLHRGLAWAFGGLPRIIRRMIRRLLR